MSAHAANSSLQQYYRSIGQTMLARAQGAVTSHRKLTGEQREQIATERLAPILPQKFQFSRGEVIDAGGHRSNEADIVIWDAYNYPSIEQGDHRVFFAESVRAIVEVKSDWGTREFADIRNKCRRIHSLMQFSEPNLADRVELLEWSLEAVARRQEPPSATISKPRIGTVAIVYNGGQTLGSRDLTEHDIQNADDDWPDLLLLLSAGQVVIKRYFSLSMTGGIGRLDFFMAGDDALLVFTSALLQLLDDRVVHVDERFYLDLYVDSVIDQIAPYRTEEFRLTRPAPGKHLVW